MHIEQGIEAQVQRWRDPLSGRGQERWDRHYCRRSQRCHEERHRLLQRLVEMNVFISFNKYLFIENSFIE